MDADQDMLFSADDTPGDAFKKMLSLEVKGMAPTSCSADSNYEEDATTENEKEEAVAEEERRRREEVHGGWE